MSGIKVITNNSMSQSAHAIQHARQTGEPLAACYRCGELVPYFDAGSIGNDQRSVKLCNRCLQPLERDESKYQALVSSL